MNRMKILWVFVMLMCLPSLVLARGGDFWAGEKTFLLDGKPFVVKAAEMHYPRIPRQYWDHRLKMVKALGMNTVCLYVFWNLHEEEPGKFDFSGNKDVAEFCRLAKKNGLYVIVRPGPYVCAEWEMGGLPWWLLKKKDIRLRDNDPYYLERVEMFEAAVAKELSPLTIQRGGPIIMVQVENEFGAYAQNKPYVSKIRDMVKKHWQTKDGGHPVLFQCDWWNTFQYNGLEDLIWTVNFGTGSNIDKQFSLLREARPNTPLMCSEFWSGWFDKWGTPHETRKAETMVSGINEMLSKGISFSLYMTIGGTSFGHWAGANDNSYAPDVTSYDYDAPISESGLATEKYHLLRQTLQKYSATPLPDVPEAIPTIDVPEFELKEYVPIHMGQTALVRSDRVKTYEELDMGFGCVSYQTTLDELKDSTVMTIAKPHDYVQVLLGGQLAGVLDRRLNQTQIKLPPVKAGTRLTLFVEALGRVNFGHAIYDYKGLASEVTLQVNGEKKVLSGWEMMLIPDDYATVKKAFSPREGLATHRLQGNGRGYYRGTFRLKKTGDTFLNFSTWGKGQVYVNGHPLGRIWQIGPQQTLYMPGCWLKKGENEIIVQDVVGPSRPVVWGQQKPELNKLQMEEAQRRLLEAQKQDASQLPDEQ